MHKNAHLFDAKPGTAASAPVDWWVINDAASGGVVDLLHGKRLHQPEKVKVFIDHDTPCGSVEVALKQRTMIRFAEENGCELFNGYGISHQIMLDRFARSGDVVAGCFTFPAMYGATGAFGVSVTPETLAQSLQSGEISFTVPHTVAIKLEGAFTVPSSAKDAALFLRAQPKYGTRDARVVFTGEGAAAMPLAERTALCQMLNASVAVFDPLYAGTVDHVLDFSSLVPMIAGPDNTDVLAPASSFSGEAVNEVFLGGCSGGRIEDLRVAASILAGKRVPPRVRLMVAPATSEVYRQAADEGLLATFLDAGAILMNQGCSVCWGKSQGIVDDGEVLLSAGSYNHKGCAGTENSRVYLCSPAIAAHSALAGTIRGGS
ncbi:MAG: Homoaconitase large subunit [Desulfovibrio sp.]